MSAKVRVGTSHTDEIPVRNGLRLGCSMAPVLFNLFFALVLEKWRMQMDRLYPGSVVSFCFKINGNLFNRSHTSHETSSAPDLEFADDAVLITPSREAAHCALTTFAAVATSFGLSVNFAKTKVMACGVVVPEASQPFLVNEQVVEVVESFVYLGSMLTPDGRSSSEVDCRLASAVRAFGALECVFRNKDLSVCTKKRIYTACVLSSLLYGAECWATLRCDETRLDAFHHKCLRNILGVTRLDQQRQNITNADLRR